MAVSFTDLVGWYDFKSSKTADRHTSANNLTELNAGKVLYYPGSSVFFDEPTRIQSTATETKALQSSSASFSFSGSFTICGWIDFRSLPTGSAGSWIINKRGVSPNTGWQFFVRNAAANALAFMVYDSANTEFLAQSAVPTVYVPVFFCLRFVASTQIELRVDDGSFVTTAYTEASVPAASSVMRIGYHSWADSDPAQFAHDGSGFFYGLWARALSDAEVDELYAAGHTLDYNDFANNTASVTLTLKDPASGGSAWISKTGLAVDVSVDRDSAPFYSATGQSTNGSGELAIAATGCPLASGTQTVWIRVTDSDGLAGGVGNDSNAFYAPVSVTVA